MDKWSRLIPQREKKLLAGSRETLRTRILSGSLLFNYTVMLKKIKSPLSLSLLWFLTPLYFLFLSLQSLFFSFVITFIKHFLSYKRNPTISIVLPSFVLWQTPLSDLINVKRIMTFTSSTASHLNPCVQPIYIFHQQNILVCFPIVNMSLTFHLFFVF